jgi:hypothetical protein
MNKFIQLKNEFLNFLKEIVDVANGYVRKTSSKILEKFEYEMTKKERVFLNSFFLVL